MEAPNKRLKPLPSSFDNQDNFVPIGHNESAEFQSGRRNNAANRSERRQSNHFSESRGDQDRPKSKHALPSHEPWILVKTKLGRRFVHNTQTKESLWRFPRDVLPGVKEFDRWEQEQKEKAENAKWAEEQLKQMRDQSKATAVNDAADKEGRKRRRRSESLQREDEEAMMAELAAQAQHAEEQDAKEVVKTLEPLQPQTETQGASYDSDSSYEEVEVTDSEFEDGDDQSRRRVEGVVPDGDSGEAEDAPVEFGEDDIAYQLAAMGDQYGLDPGEYGEADDDEWEEGAEDLPLSEEDAVNLFRDMLEEYQISPFTPWDKVIADDTETSILNDDRYTVLTTMRARKEAWDNWVRDKAAQIKEERANMEKQDPKIPYLAFLQEKATPKLYWPEFKRKFKRDAEMNDRRLNEKDREKLYREHINRLKLPETTRKADLRSLLERVPRDALSRSTRLQSLPQQILSHLHYISLPPSVRDPIIELHIRSLPSTAAS